MFSVDADTLPVGAVVGIVISALVGLIIAVIVTIVAVAVLTRWWNKEDSETNNLTIDVSMGCSMQTPYCVLQEFVCIYMEQDAV